ncbi:MAG: hypothetical protein M1840_000051 [Geoglossum simile]|nr:MAG: hypothetical protein M1840_000051 [Geoglossum simile]
MARAKGTGNHGVKISWTADNDRKLLLSIIDKSKNYNVKELVALFPGGTTKALEERIAKLKRESNALLTTFGIDIPTPRKRKVDNIDDDREAASPSPKKKMMVIKTPDPVKKQEHQKREHRNPASLYSIPPAHSSDHTDADSGDSDDDGSDFVKYE